MLKHISILVVHHFHFLIETREQTRKFPPPFYHLSAYEHEWMFSVWLFGPMVSQTVNTCRQLFTKIKGRVFGLAFWRKKATHKYMHMVRPGIFIPPIWVRVTLLPCLRWLVHEEMWLREGPDIIFHLIFLSQYFFFQNISLSRIIFSWNVNSFKNTDKYFFFKIIRRASGWECVCAWTGCGVRRILYSSKNIAGCEGMHALLWIIPTPGKQRTARLKFCARECLVRFWSRVQLSTEGGWMSWIMGSCQIIIESNSLRAVIACLRDRGISGIVIDI